MLVLDICLISETGHFIHICSTSSIRRVCQCQFITTVVLQPHHRPSRERQRNVDGQETVKEEELGQVPRKSD